MTCGGRLGASRRPRTPTSSVPSCDPRADQGLAVSRCCVPGAGHPCQSEAGGFPWELPRGAHCAVILPLSLSPTSKGPFSAEPLLCVILSPLRRPLWGTLFPGVGDGALESQSPPGHRERLWHTPLNPVGMSPSPWRGLSLGVSGPLLRCEDFSDHFSMRNNGRGRQRESGAGGAGSTEHRTSPSSEETVEVTDPSFHCHVRSSRARSFTQPSFRKETIFSNTHTSRSLWRFAAGL